MYKYKLKESYTGQSYTYRGVQLKKTSWYVSRDKIKFPIQDIIEENVNSTKSIPVIKKDIIPVDSKDYSTMFKIMTTPIKKENMIIYRPFKPERANFIIIQEKGLAKSLDLTWNTRKKCYIKKIFFKNLFFYGFNPFTKKWEAQVSLYDGQKVDVKEVDYFKFKAVLVTFLDSRISIQ
jgi:hypothetical protein